MAHDGRVRPGMLCVYAYLAVFEDNERDGLVKPPKEKTWSAFRAYGDTGTQKLPVFPSA